VNETNHEMRFHFPSWIFLSVNLQSNFELQNVNKAINLLSVVNALISHNFRFEL